MNYNQAEKIFFSWVSQPRSRSKTIGLVRTQRLLDLLSNPEFQIPHYIHVTGTSGKGSVCAYLQSILSTSGKKTGLFVSPHPTFLTERWSINGKPMPSAAFVRIIQKLAIVLRLYDKKYPNDPPAFFELCTAIALFYFAEQKVDWTVIEVGAGGELDPTNVIPHKDVAIITNIGLDHMELLGNTKEKIASAKSGIITPGAAVFTTEKNKKLQTILQKKCQSVGVALQKIAEPKNIQTTLTGTTFSYKNKKYYTPAIGPKQAANAVLAIASTQHLHISEKNIKTGLKNVEQPLRFEIISKNPLIILDGAHNPDKMNSTVKTLQTLSANKKSQLKNIHLIVGFSANKQYPKMIQKLIALQPSSIACTQNTINPFRGVADPATIAQLFQKKLPKTNIEIFSNPAAALKWSRAQTKTNDALLVTGSIFLSGELRPLFKKKTTS